MGYQTEDHLPINRGFASHVGYLHGSENYEFGNHDQAYYHKDFWHDSLPGDDVVDEIYYSTNWYTERAVGIINNHSLDQPLWLHLPYQAIHSPYSEPPAWEQIPTDTGFWDQTLGSMLAVVDSGIGNVTRAMKAR